MEDSSLFDELTSKGVKVFQKPQNHPWAYEMKFEDIDGNVLWLGTEPRKDLPFFNGPNHINSFMNFRVAEIQACYELWKSRGAEFITEPIPKYGETRCYIRDPDGYIIEVGQSTDLTYG